MVTTLADVRARVEDIYDHLDMPSWPDPHPTREPREAEYSRVTDPGRYRIVHARALAWTEALATVPGVEVEPLARGSLGQGRHRGEFDRGVRLTSPRPDTLPLLLLEREAAASEDAFPKMAVLHISVGRPDLGLEMQPDCGCDACDSGSQDLLDAIDAAISPVVAGPYVVLLGRGWQAHWYPDGWSAVGNAGVPDRVEDWCRRIASGEPVGLPEGTEAHLGGHWFE